jgi:7,8-dihydropterin-6-yl-methyl-4-(beta-D-ribofuranosyl)aminobenzene 5'-phosphate synthase
MVSTRSVIKLMVIGLSILSGLSACKTGSISSSENPLSKAAEPLQQSTAVVENTSTPQPTLTPEDTPEPTPQPTEAKVEMMTITIVFDNYPYKKGLKTAWGFSAFVTYKDQNVLFDTGISGSILLENMSKMNITPVDVQNVVLSHEHNDHIGGLQALLSAGADPKIYLPPSFSPYLKNQFRKQAEVIEVVPGHQIAERIYSLGEIQGLPSEQALVIDTPRGLVVIIGCAHPGVEKMVLAAKRQFEEGIYLVMGGFHLGGASRYEVEQIIKEFKRIGVAHVAPCHCTGDRAINQFKNAFGERFISVGVGAVIEIES